MRESGILMPVSCLPGPFGIGTLGKGAYDFVDFLARAGQRCGRYCRCRPRASVTARTKAARPLQAAHGSLISSPCAEGGF